MLSRIIETIKTELKKYRTKKRISMATAVTLSLVVFAELMFTGMKFEEHYTIYVTADGTAKQIVMHKSDTVSDALTKAGIILGENDIVNYSVETNVENNMNIDVDRVEYVDISKSTPLRYETVYVESSLLPMGTEIVNVDGRNGCEITTYTEKLINGVVVESEISDIETREPVTRLVTVGTAFSEPYSKRLGNFELDNGIPTEYAYIVSGKVTAYTAPPGSGTYSGRPLEVGTVAVNPNIIPFGSELYICSKDGKRVYGYAIAADTGDLTEVVADVFMGLTSEHYGDACDWGAQFCDVYVLSIGDNSVSWM